MHVPEDEHGNRHPGGIKQSQDSGAGQKVLYGVQVFESVGILVPFGRCGAFGHFSQQIGSQLGINGIVGPYQKPGSNHLHAAHYNQGNNQQQGDKPEGFFAATA